MTLPFSILILLTIPLGAILLAILLPGYKNLLRAQGLFTKTNEKIIYPFGPLFGIIAIIPSLLFNQYIDTNPSFSTFNSQCSIFLASYLLLFFVSIKKDFHKTYPLQWFIVWLIITVILNDFGKINLLNRFQFSNLNAQLTYWFSLLLLYLLLMLLHLLNMQFPSSPKSRSWIFLPSLIGIFTYMYIYHLSQGIFLPAAMIGIYLFTLYLNRNNASNAWDPGFTSCILTNFSLFWLILIQPAQHQYWLLLITFMPLMIIAIASRLKTITPFKK